MKFSPTDEQLEIIGSRLSRSVVTASAGAGKTGVIVSHYRQLVLEDGLRPDEILAITFTRKAAAEMKTRIVSELRAAGRADLAQVAETGPIQTIHGFCQRLLTENALAAGLDPEFEIASESQKRIWQEQAIRDTLAESYDEEPEVQLVIEHLAGRRANEGGRASISPYGLIEGSLRTLLNQMRGSGRDRRQILQDHANSSAVLSTWQKAVYEWLPDEVRQGVSPPPSDSSEFLASISSEYKRLKRAMPSFVRSVADRDEADAGLTSGLVKLACTAWYKLENVMVRHSALDFTLLEEQAILALQEEEVRTRVAKQYRVGLIDEAQDLNPLQYQLLNSLDVERLMLVGDRQQSIYAFRQADVELFIKSESLYPAMRLTRNHRSDAGILRFVDTIFAEVWSETYQRMAVEKIIETDDNVIDLFGPEKEVGDFAGVELWPMELADATDVARRIKSLVDDLPDGLTAKNVCVLVRDSMFGERLYRALDRHRVSAKLVGVSKQYYTRMEVRDIANALRALADPFDDFALAATLASPFACVSYDAITLLSQEKPIFDRLRTVDLPDGDRERLDAFLAWFEPLSMKIDRMTAGEAIAALLGQTDYLQVLARRPNGRQTLANVRKLQRIACSDELVSPREFAEQIRETQALRHDESDEPTHDEDSDAVSIMTIHRSKGLEFEVVVVPQTTRKIGKIRDEDVRFDPRVGIAAASFGAPHSRYFLWLQELRKEREMAEDWRVVYVALTRAKKRLCVVTREKGAHTVADAIAKHSGFKEGTPLGVKIRE